MRHEGATPHVYRISIVLGIITGGIVIGLGALVASLPLEGLSWDWPFVVGMATVLVLNRMPGLISPHLERWLA